MKKLLFLLSLILTLVVVGGCNPKKESKDVSVSEIEKVVNESELIQNKSITSKVEDIEQFKSIAGKIKESFISKAAINLKLEEVIVIKTDDPNSVYSALQAYKKDSIANSVFANGYGGQENADAASNAIVEKSGNYVYLIAAPKAKEIEKKIIEMFK